MSPDDLWHFLPRGYLTTIAIETPILVLLLSAIHTIRRRLLAGVWLTACTYPIVVLVLPVLIPSPDDRWLYLLIAEIFAPVAECALFAAAFHAGRAMPRPARWRDFVAIVIANLASFGIGEILNQRM